MKKFILASALMFSLFGISYGIASALDAKGVTASASCNSANCD